MDPKMATSFAPYAPPPDESDQPGKSGQNHPRASWFQPPTLAPAYSSYQSGGLPSFGKDQAGITGFGGGGEEQGVTNLWETCFGWRVDVLAAAAYLLGPISGQLLRPRTFLY